MARTGYSLGTRASSSPGPRRTSLPCSPKHAIEIARFIRNQDVNNALDYLNEVVALKKAVPFRRFNRNVAHKRGLVGWDAGRYPVKASKGYIKLLEGVKKNAEYSGLDADRLVIVHAAANRGRGQKAFFPRAMGRATPKRRETVNIEIIVQEVQE